ncbi:NLI interacting factor-like phosphatase-domain-containing protein [Melampsora americana]|nr:NLI interacting factor-like phosphatase-domain-containing protein [Melampsora americana]
MNSLNWLLSPKSKSSFQLHSNQSTINSTTSLTSTSTSTSTNHLTNHSNSSNKTSIDNLISGPRESESELVDEMVESVERLNGIEAANNLERKASLNSEGEVRVGLTGISERRRTFNLKTSPTKPALKSLHLATLKSSKSKSNSSSSPTRSPKPSSSSTSKSSSSSSNLPSVTITQLDQHHKRSHQLARLLPVRLGVNLYILIRKFLAIFGLRLPPAPSEHSTLTSNLLSVPSTPSKSLNHPSTKSKNRKPIKQIKKIPIQPKSESTTTLLGNTRNKTLVLDLDETLIHSTSRLGGMGGTGTLGGGGTGSAVHASLKVRVVEVVLDGRIVVYHVYKRPWVDFFLKTVSSWYTVVIFTASMREYADPVIDWLDQGRGIIDGRLFRESCTNIKGSYMKDLTIVERDLSKVCLVDNSPISYGLHQANGIPIEGWLNDPTDEGLLDLLPMLDSLRFTKDVRRILGLRGFSEPSNLNQTHHSIIKKTS